MESLMLRLGSAKRRPKRRELGWTSLSATVLVPTSLEGRTSENCRCWSSYQRANSKLVSCGLSHG